MCGSNDLNNSGKFSNEEFNSKLKSYFRSKSALESYISLDLVYSIEDYTENPWRILNDELITTESYCKYNHGYSSLVLLSDEYSIYLVNDLGDKYYVALRNANNVNKQTTE